MNSNYNYIPTKFTEKLADLLFKSAGLNSQLNNLANITAVDILIEDKKVDIQYSNNFSKYGDYRIDLISAFSIDNRSTIDKKQNSSIDIFQQFEKNNNVKILKKGKFFENEHYLDYIVVFFYNETLNKEIIPHEFTIENLNKEVLPDHTLILRKEALMEYIENNKDYLLTRIKINNKAQNKIYESHGSAFVPIDVMTLVKSLDSKNYIFSKNLPEINQLRQFF